MTRKQYINHALSLALTPDILIIENESSNHQVPVGSETHFKVIVVSAEFINLSRVARHRLVNNILAQEFSTGLHALSLHLYTPNEWAQRSTHIPASPACEHKRKNEV